jgi:hypothetical protein
MHPGEAPGIVPGTARMDLEQATTHLLTTLLTTVYDVCPS